MPIDVPADGQVCPLLGPLQDNGGHTQTHALLPNSPAIDTAVFPASMTNNNEYYLSSTTAVSNGSRYAMCSRYYISGDITPNCWKNNAYYARCVSDG